MMTRLEVEAGWYAVLRVPALEPDEHLAVRLIRDYGISVHPGYFFGFSSDGWLVISLLAPVEAFLVELRYLLCFQRSTGASER